MSTACIIAEYHPFHNGHAHMAAQLHAMGYDAVIAAMSGNFVQRGTPALLPVQVRAEAALACGVDLVLQLPCRTAAATAQRFAAAGVAAAVAAGADVLAFGAETPDIKTLQQVTAALRDERFAPLLKEQLNTGLPFHTARANAAEQLYPGAAALLAQPNNILAVEYIAALETFAATDCRVPEPLPLPRLGAAHDGIPAQGIASASWLRAQPPEQWENYVPEAALSLYRRAFAEGLVLDAARWECAALAQLRTRTRQELAALPDATEGLDALLHTAIRQSTSLEEIYTAVKSKRYAHARIRRLVLAAVLNWGAPSENIPKTVLNNIAAFPAGNACTDLLRTACFNVGVPYLRVLGATATGRQALAVLAGRSPVPVSPSLAELERQGGAATEAARCEAAAGDLYALCLRRPQPCGQEYRLPFLTGSKL